jgi:hypothetical protein
VTGRLLRQLFVSCEESGLDGTSARSPGASGSSAAASSAPGDAPSLVAARETSGEGRAAAFASLASGCPSAASGQAASPREDRFAPHPAPTETTQRVASVTSARATRADGVAPSIREGRR